MLVFWGVVGGLTLGAVWPGGGELTSWVGIVLGLVAGLTLRWAVRKEVRGQLAASEKKIKSELLAQLKVVGAVTVAAAPVIRQEAPDGLADNERTVLPTALTGVPEATQSAPPRAVSSVIRQPIFIRENKGDTSTPTGSARPQITSPNALESALSTGFNAARGWLLGGNTIVRVGLVILFIGLSFLARYAAVSGLLPVEFRLAAIAAAGIALLAVGFKKRDAKPGFALALQGAGVAVMYLTVFAAYKLYELLPALPAFGLMLVVCALSCALALLQNARSLAVVAFAGGFAVPVLLSTGQGSHVGLFSYYSVLNLAILFIAHKRSWRILNLVGFIATFGVATAWGALKFTPENYVSTQPFLIGFVLI